ncbi:uncharacterized protein N7459_006235, partial [Penicillium hispanicum]|uniref:uncharacterized protein n=1 Tax=Penicillium hispanicum TaxID=1080232 RepID=UPI00254144E5
MSSTRRFIQSFRHIPTELFRVNRTATINLRAKPGLSRPRTIFDLLTFDGKVQPKALNPGTYESDSPRAEWRLDETEFSRTAESGPKHPRQCNHLCRSGGYAPWILLGIMMLTKMEGIVLPDDLIIVHEFGDHYSLQARQEMTVEGRTPSPRNDRPVLKIFFLELNHKITAFLGTYGTQYTRNEWLRQYSRAT